ncbi:MAG: TonB-dependent receptor, partial [Bradyrhizobium sp.]
SNPNGRIPTSRNSGEPGFDRVKFDQAFLGYEFRHRFNDAVEFRQNLRVGQVDVDMVSMRNGSGLCPTLADPSCYGFNPANFDPAQRVTVRDANFVGGSTKNFTIDNQLQANFATGWLQHKMLFGLDYQKTEVSTDFRGSFLGFPLDVYNPVYGATPLPSKAQMIPFINTDSKQDQLGLYIQDQIKLDRWSLTLTGRHDRATANTTNHLAGVVVPQEDSAFTGRAGLNYLFDFGLAPYVSYSTSFQPVAGTQLTTATGQPFRPTTGEGLEVGIKYQPPGLKLLFTAAAFDITQRNVVVNTPQFIPFQIGGVRVRGVETDLRANITERLDIIAGASHLEPVVTDHVDTRIVGKDMSAVNRDSAFLWGFYTMRDGPLAGLGFGGGVRYTGSLWGDDLNTVPIPPHTLFDAALSFDFSYLRRDLKGLHLRVNATNLTDKYYVSNCFTGLPYCTLGQPRTVMATLTYRWNETPSSAPLITKY